MLHSILNFASSIAFVVGATFGINRWIEEPRYDVVEHINAVEIRQYRKRIAAETTVAAGGVKNVRGEAFRMLAGFIFGANKARQKIDMTSPVAVSSAGTKMEMTAPVAVDSSERGLTMRFFMPVEYSKERLPEPSDPRVTLVEMPPTTMAVLSFSGSTGDTAVAVQTAALMKALQQTTWKVSGPTVALLYNPPWTLPFFRRNEVAVPVSR
jgi:SOUL heme-binding protein